MGSRYFGAQHPYKPHIADHAASGELKDLREDAEKGFMAVQVEMDAGPAPGAHHASHVTGTDQLADANATGPVHGLMSGADKVRLDGMETGANVTANHAPQAHAASHVTGADQLADAIAGGAHGLLLGADKTKLDNLTTANIPSSGEKAALAGTNGTPSGANKFVTNSDPRLSGLLPVGAPTLDRLDVFGGAAVVAAGGDIKLVGRNLLQGQTFDGLQMTETPAFFQMEALKPGISGITAEIVVGAGILSVAFNPGTGALVITLPAIGDTDDNIATAINADLSPCNGYVRAVSGSAGSFTAAQGPTALFGGAGDYANNKVMVGGLEALPANETGTAATAKWSGTGIKCTTRAVGAATDVAAIVVQSNAVWSQPLSAVMV